MNLATPNVMSLLCKRDDFAFGESYDMIARKQS
jgi:hypothetical protein